MIAGGDLNIWRRKSDRPTPWTWPDAMHYGTVFDRMAAIRAIRRPPGSARTATNLPAEPRGLVMSLPSTRRREGRPEKSNPALDFVFATRNIADRVAVRALNEVQEWGPSDHCRILIELPDPRRTAREKPDLVNWSCDQCDVTLDTLVAGFRKRWPDDDPNKYLPRIIGGHRAPHPAGEESQPLTHISTRHKRASGRSSVGVARRKDRIGRMRPASRCARGMRPVESPTTPEERNPGGAP